MICKLCGSRMTSYGIYSDFQKHECRNVSCGHIERDALTIKKEDLPFQNVT